MKSRDPKNYHDVATPATEEEMEIVRKRTGTKYNKDALRALINGVLRNQIKFPLEA